eukprot:GSChrysophyteH1.ASY1.ANO1.2034.1 assembled CDS
MSIWDLCTLDLDTEVLLSDIIETAPSSSSSTSHSDVLQPYPGIDEEVGEEIACDTGVSRAGFSDNSVDSLQKTLFSAEESCRNFMQELDTIVFILGEIGVSFNDVTGRTNSLMLNCEALLDQQHTLDVTVEKLRSSLKPFDDVELIAKQLGIPIDARSDSITLGKSSNPNFHTGVTRGMIIGDPRSSEFKGLLVRMRDSLQFLSENREYMDTDKYHHWLVQLRGRAFALVSRAMKSLLESATSQVLSSEGSRLRNTGSIGAVTGAEKVSLEAMAAKMLSDDLPIEGSAIYRKFRGLGFRMKELQRLMDTSAMNADGTAASDSTEVRQAYISSRQSLLLPFVKELTIARAVKTDSKRVAEALQTDLSELDSSLRTKMTLTGKATEIFLGAAIHHAYSLLLRVCQLEHQLFEVLFVDSENTEGAPSDPPADDGAQNQSSKEVNVIVTSLCTLVCDGLRPLIIHENSVDELCRVASTLADDVRSQIASVQLPTELLGILEQGVDRTVCDTQERLVYCAEMRLRKEVQLFKPLLAQLDYPQVLQETESGADSANGLDAAKAWFPPLRHTLALLSKLYGIVEPAVFEDFASRAVRKCIQSLESASNSITSARPAPHGDLFLVRSLLILREQLMPFDIKLQGKERKLDFTTTGAAFSQFTSNPRQALRFDKLNSLWQLATDGLPSMTESSVDAKREIDDVLKAACGTLKESTTRMLLSGLDQWLSKVAACVGDIPISHDTVNDSSRLVSQNKPASLPSEQVSILKSQSFMRNDRILEVLQEANATIAEKIPDLGTNLKLYVSSSTTRAILLKPVQQEVEVMKRKVETLLAACISPGQERRDMEELVESISASVRSSLVV